MNQEQFNEAKLRDRKQGPEETTAEFFYVLDLFRKVNTYMTEVIKLVHLCMGLKSSVVEKLLMFKAKTCDELLWEVKQYQ